MAEMNIVIIIRKIYVGRAEHSYKPKIISTDCRQLLVSIL